MRKRIFGLLLYNFPYKVIAVILATLFWYIVQGEEILEVNVPINITIEAPDGYMVKGGPVRRKDATIRGPRVLIANIPTKALEARIAIREKAIKTHRFRIDREFIRDWDNRLKLTVHDAYLTVYVDEQISSKVNIEATLQGVPADGFNIEKVVIKPNKASITGLRNEISKIEVIYTEPIDINNINQSKSIDAALIAKGFDKDGLSVDKVNVSIMVGEKKVNKKFKQIPIDVVGSSYVATSRPKYVDIEIQGTSGVLNFIKRKDLRAFVEAREATPGRFEKDIQVQIPPDTTLIETLPSKATVEIYNQKRLN